MKKNDKKSLFLIISILLLFGCATDIEEYPPLWVKSLETLPQVEGFRRAGVFTINGKLYVQNCDSEGNQIWMRYNKKTHMWRQSRFNTLGCVKGENSTGPDDELFD